MNKLLKLANHLDQKGEYELADMIDLIIQASGEDEREKIEEELRSIEMEQSVSRQLPVERIRELHEAKTNAMDKLRALQSGDGGIGEEEQAHPKPDVIMDNYFGGDAGKFNTGSFIRELRSSWRYWKNKE